MDLFEGPIPVHQAPGKIDQALHLVVKQPVCRLSCHRRSGLVDYVHEAMIGYGMIKSLLHSVNQN